MPGTTFISPLNTLAFRPNETNRPDRYRRGHLDTDWQKDLVLEFQKPDYYRQKIRRGNRFRFQVKSTANISRAFQLRDCHGKLMLDFSPAATVTKTGDVDAQGQQYITYQYKLPDFSSIPLDGTYYFVYSVDYDGSHSDTFVSEPLYLADEHPGTICIEYSNTENVEGVLFEEIPTIFSFLLEAYIDDYKPKVVSQVYASQRQDAITLDYRVSDSFRLLIGQETEGVADWVYKKLTYIMGCDRTLLNGLHYTSGGAVVDIQDGQGSPLKAGTLDIQPGDQKAFSTFSNRSIILYEQPPYPHMLANIAVGNIHTIIQNTEVADPTAQTAAIAQMNTNIGDTELLGTVTLSGGVIQYNLAPGESFTTALALIHTNKVTFSFSPASAANLAMFIGRGNTTVNWGDGAIVSYAPTGGVLGLSINHTYSSSGIYSVKIWGNPDALSITNSILTYSSGLFPQGMKSLYLSGIQWPSNAFQFSSLANAANSLTSLSIVNGALTSAPGFNSQLMPVLKTINFSDNPFSTTNKSLFHYDVWLNAQTVGIANGTFTVLQTPYVPLNALGNNYKSILQNPPFNWTVNS